MPLDPWSKYGVLAMALGLCRSRGCDDASSFALVHPSVACTFTQLVDTFDDFAYAVAEP